MHTPPQQPPPWKSRLEPGSSQAGVAPSAFSSAVFRDWIPPLALSQDSYGRIVSQRGIKAYPPNGVFEIGQLVLGLIALLREGTIRFFGFHTPIVGWRIVPVLSHNAVERSVMTFRNRDHAAGLLAHRLAEYRGQRPLVLAIPRGAVPMAAIIADSLGGELDVVLVRKLGAPGQPELAIGAVDEAGTVLKGAYFHVADEEYLRDEIRAQLKVIRAR